MKNKLINFLEWFYLKSGWLTFGIIGFYVYAFTAPIVLRENNGG